MQFDIKAHTILEVVHGSHAYGLNSPESDIDIRGIAVPPEEYFFSCDAVFEQYEGPSPNKIVNGQAPIEDNDTVIYDIRKFCKLALDGNPNIIEILWIPERCVKIMTDEAKEIIAHRDLFLSKKVRHTFSGYAHAQLKRIKGHRRWLLDPPKVKPTRVAYGLPEENTVSPAMKGLLRVMEAAEGEGGITENIVSPFVLETLKKERAYHSTLLEWTNYEKWQRERNPKRAALEAKFGYDTKHAMHLVRLMTMCREILTTGAVIVERPDREFLLSIRGGAWPYEKLLEWAEAQDAELETIYQNCNILPYTADRKAVGELCMKIVKKRLGIR